MNAPKVKQLSSLASKPQLISILIDDPEIVAANDGYALEFYTWDRQPLATFMKLANVDQTNTEEMVELARTLILDKDGNVIVNDDNTLKTQVLMAAITKVVATLGN
jgi:hypothetical protein